MGDSPLNLNTTDLPRASGSEAEATASPSRLARGKETAKDLRLKLLGSRLPLGPWDFWHDRQGRTRKEAHTDPNVAAEEKPSFANKPAYGDSLEVLQSNINSVKRFWQVYNGFENFSDKLPSKDSVHLFLSGIKPVWEDPQNAKGGSWTFRVAKAKASELYKEMCVLAIGGTLQAAVKADRENSNNEICGISYSVRSDDTVHVTVWNSDGSDEKGIDNLSKTIVDNLSAELRPRESKPYYKKHSEHADFTVTSAQKAAMSPPK